MKYIFAVIAGMVVGTISHEGNGYIVGGIIGFLIVQLVELKNKVKKLENFIRQKGIQNTTVESSVPEVIPEPQEIDSVHIAEELNDSDESLAPVQHAIHNTSQISVTENIIQPQEETVEVSRDKVNEINDKLKNESFDEIPQESVSVEKVQHVDVTPKEPIEKTKPAILEPSAIEIGIDKIKFWVVGYFTGGNMMVRSGVLVLFIGVAFLLKYVAERTVVPVEYRYVGISLASLVMLILGWKLRKKRPGFALSLEGGAIGILYLTLFAAMRIHQLIPSKIVLLLLIGIVVLSAILAILENSMALAIIGMIGGFAAPILTSTGSGSHVQLFSYYLLLNCGIFAIAWFKSWRLLNVLGFVATFGIGSLWGYKYYKPDFFLSVEPFLIGYFLLYTLIAVLFAIKQPPKLKGLNDGTLIFGTPLVGFSLQAALLKDSEYGLAYSALALGVFYVILAFVLKSMKKPYLKDLIESFLALGIGFATLAIPLGFDGRVTSAMWVAEGSALLWVGIRQSRMFPRFSGYALTVFGSVAFFLEPYATKISLPWLNADYIGALIIVSATAFISLYARKNSAKLLKLEAKWVPSIMMFASVSWWVFAGLLEIKKHFHFAEFILLELFLAMTVVSMIFIGEKIKFNLLKILSIPVALIMLSFLENSYPILNRENTAFLNIGFIGLILMAVVHLYLSWYWASEKRHKLAAFYNNFSYMFLVLGLINWLLTFSVELAYFFPVYKFLMIEMMMAFSALIVMLCGIRFNLISYKISASVVVLLMFIPFIVMPRANLESMMFMNVRFIGMLIYSLSHFVLAWYWHAVTTNNQNLEVAQSWSIKMSNSTLMMALISWVFFGNAELLTYFRQMDFVNSSILFMILFFVIWILMAHKLKWQSLHLVKYGLTLFLIYMCLKTVIDGFTFHDSYGLAIWALAFLVNYWVLKIYDNKMQQLQHYHLLSLLLLVFVVVFELHQISLHIFGLYSIWYKGFSTFILLIVCLSLYLLRNLQVWPLKNQKTAYFKHGLSILLAVTFVSVLINHLTTPGNLSLVGYIPLLNILDLTGFAFVFLVYKIYQSQIIRIDNDAKNVFISILAITAFIILNASMLRSFHFWYAIDYKLSIMLKTFMVQAGLSILWSLTAVVLMVLAAKKHIRTMWLVGLGLMIVVVIKLFLVDMSASGTVERIIAFLSVGVLLSLVGYFSPLPPDINKAEEKSEAIEK